MLHEINCGIEGVEHCPPWYFCNTTTNQCSCGCTSHDRVECSDDSGTTRILDCFCMTYDNTTHQNEIGKCIFNCESAGYNGIDKVYHPLPGSITELSNSSCGKFNRKGTLCGKCKNSYYPLAYSYNLTCVKCEINGYNWLLYTITAFLPLTIFFFIVLILRISVLHSHLFGFVMYSQGLSFPIMARIVLLSYNGHPAMYILIGLIGSLCGIWNLDFGRLLVNGFCIHPDIMLLNSLDLVVGLYPLFLIIVTHISIVMYDRKFKIVVALFKPFKALSNYLSLKFEIRTSLVDAFASFLFLSNVKIFSVAFDFLAPVKVDLLSASGEFSQEYRLFFDATIIYFGEEHLIYATLCLIMLFLFVLLPTVILGLYPFRFFQNCLNKLPHQMILFLHTYADIFYGCYQDGIGSGSKDCRWFASLLVFVRVILFILYGYTLNTMYFVFAPFLLVLLCNLLIIVEPFKQNTKHNYLSSIFSLCLASMYIGIVGSETANLKDRNLIGVFQVILITVGMGPIVFMALLALYWVFNSNLTKKFLKT